MTGLDMRAVGAAASGSDQKAAPKSESTTPRPRTRVAFGVAGPRVYQGADLEGPRRLEPYDGDQRRHSSFFPLDIRTAATDVKGANDLVCYALGPSIAGKIGCGLSSVAAGYGGHEWFHWIAVREEGGESYDPPFPLSLFIDDGQNLVVEGERPGTDRWVYALSQLHHRLGGLYGMEAMRQEAGYGLMLNGEDFSNTFLYTYLSFDPMFQAAVGAITGWENEDTNRYAELMHQLYPEYKDTKTDIMVRAVVTVSDPMTVYSFVRAARGFTNDQPLEDMDFWWKTGDVSLFPTIDSALTPLGPEIKIGAWARIAQGREPAAGYAYVRSGTRAGPSVGAGFGIRNLHFGNTPYYADFEGHVWHQPDLPNRLTGTRTLGPIFMDDARYGPNEEPGFFAVRAALGMDVMPELSVQVGVEGKQVGVLPPDPIPAKAAVNLKLIFRLPNDA